MNSRFLEPIEALEPINEGAAAYAFALALKRETMVRCGLLAPREGNAAEERQALEGPVPPADFDCARVAS